MYLFLFLRVQALVLNNFHRIEVQVIEVCCHENIVHHVNECNIFVIELYLGESIKKK